MAVTFELWDTRTGNMVGAFESETAALELVRQTIRAHGSGYVADLLLGREDDDGRSEKIARGTELVELAQTGRRLSARRSA